MAYAPPQELLERYARLVVGYGLGGGEGIQAGETVLVSGAEDAKPLYFEVCKEVWRQGGHVLHRFHPEDDPGLNFTTAYYELASDDQLAHFPEAHTRGLVEQIDHMVFIVGDRHLTAAADVDPARRALEAPALAKYWAIRNAKERTGALDWTIVLWGTAGLAAEAGLDLEAYWAQIIDACLLGEADPVAAWKALHAELHTYRDWLNGLDIERMHVQAPGTDLWLTLGEQRRWIGGGGANIPSFELFTSPDWRGTEGTVTFTEPLYYQGTLIRDAALTFAGGEVVSSQASTGAEHLAAMVSQPGGNRVGEFSLTDTRLSKITAFMAETLYDENVGGPNGNTHLAIGLSITECFDGEEEGVSDETWQALGFNVDASLHVDIVATSPRTVTATMGDGSERVIYADGRFQTGA